MPHHSAVLDAPADPIKPDMLEELKKEDEKQAIVERFRGRIKDPAAARRAKRACKPADRKK